MTKAWILYMLICGANGECQRIDGGAYATQRECAFAAEVEAGKHLDAQVGAVCKQAGK